MGHVFLVGGHAFAMSLILDCLRQIMLSERLQMCRDVFCPVSSLSCHISPSDRVSVFAHMCTCAVVLICSVQIAKLLPGRSDNNVSLFAIPTV
jgi:hypothetical protein